MCRSTESKRILARTACLSVRMGLGSGHSIGEQLAIRAMRFPRRQTDANDRPARQWCASGAFVSKRFSLALCCVLVVFAGCGRAAPENVEFSRDDLQRLQLDDLDGQPYDPWSVSKAEIRVFLFTGIDCPISNRYAPEVRRLHERFSPRGVEFLLVYPHVDETPEEIRKHIAEYDYPCAAVRDPKKTLAMLTHATVTPEAVVIGPGLRMIYRGRIDDLYVDFGKARSAATTHDLIDVLDALIDGQNVATRTTEAVGCFIEGMKPVDGPAS